MPVNPMKPGQSLLEALLAIAVILSVTIAASTLIVSTVAAGQSSSDKIAAANFAREGIEVIRGIRDSNWLKRAQNVTNPITGLTYDWDDNPWWQTTHSGEDPKFKKLGTTVAGTSNVFIAHFDPVTGWSLISSIYTSSWAPISAILDTGIDKPDANAAYLSQQVTACSVPCDPTKYSRTITVTKTNDTFFGANDATYLNVVSTVTWQNHGLKTYSVSEKMYDWK